MVAEEIWYNANIWTLDADNPTAVALAIGAGKIIAAGSDIDILNLVEPATRTSNLHGRQILPGFVESHTHALLGWVSGII